MSILSNPRSNILNKLKTNGNAPAKILILQAETTNPSYRDNAMILPDGPKIRTDSTL